MEKKYFVFLIVILNILTVNLIFAGDCNIDWGITYQTISGFGGSSAWSEWSGCPCGTNTFLVNNIQQFFSQTNGIGLTIIRARIPPDQGQWGSTVPPLQAARDQGALIMATVWTPPASWKSNGAVHNSDGGYLLPEYYDEYANYLVNYVNTLKNTYNINLYAISPANEPDYQVSYDGCSWTGAQLRDFIKNYLGPAFTANNITTKILVPESFRNDCTYADTILGDATARNYVFGIAQHIYGGGPTYCSAAGTYNKEFWQTERSSFETYDATMTHGITTAQWIHNSLVNANYNAFLYWWLAADANNEGLRGVNNGIPKRFWVMGNFSKFIRPGFVRISANANPTSGIYTSAYKNSSTGNFVIVAINTGSSSVNQPFVLNGMSVSSVTPWITDSTRDLVQQAAVSVSGNTFTYNLPARSVVSFIGVSGGVTGTPTNTFTITQTPTQVTSVLLDNFEDCNNTNNLNGTWYTYKDNNSTLSPNPFSTTSGGVSGSTICSVQITGNIVSGGYGGVGTNLNSGGTAIDLTSYAGIEFYVRGDGGTYWVQFTQPSISDGDFFGVNFTAPTNWTKVQVFFETSGLHQRGWGTPSTFTQNAVIAIQWTNYSTGAINFQIDDIRLISSSSNTVTPTYTNTFTRTFTPTFTGTFTSTRTNTATFTRTNTSTITSTFTQTASNTVTITNTNVSTSTSTATPTNSSTATRTFTFTNTFTATASNTQVQSNTYTATFTATVTRTQTSTNTRTYTLTNTATNTGTFTDTYTPTETVTGTQPPTWTNTSTATNSQTVTNSQIPTNSYTATATNSQTTVNTLTATNTATNSQVPTNSYTATATNSQTTTNTFTTTPTNTATNTQVPTSSATATNTNTLTNTFTNTQQPTVTFTITPALEGIGDNVIKDIIVYPQPFNFDRDKELKIKFKIGVKIENVKVRLYTMAYRKIAEEEIKGEKGAGEIEIILQTDIIRKLANGIYYFVIEAYLLEGKKIYSKINKINIIK